MNDESTSVHPLLFVDIDGVLNTYGGDCPPGYVEYDLFPEDDEPVRINPLTSEYLTELSQVFDLCWATGWTKADRALLPSVLPLPVFAGAAEMPPIPFDPKEKIPAVAVVAGDRPLAWIDDLHTPEGRDWAELRLAPTLLVDANPSVGFTRDHVEILLKWAERIDPR